MIFVMLDILSNITKIILAEYLDLKGIWAILTLSNKYVIE